MATAIAALDALITHALGVARARPEDVTNFVEVGRWSAR
jgi:hypothetical protein